MNKTTTTESKMNKANAVSKFQAGLAVGRSDLGRNGIVWMMRNVRTLKAMKKDNADWLRSYCAALEDAQDGEGN